MMANMVRVRPLPRARPAARAILPKDAGKAKPLYAVWELTLRCDQPCAHCGSRAGRARPDELSTGEALEVVAALARLGCREIVLIGGEAYLRDDLHEVVRALAKAGIRVDMQTGGRQLTVERARALKEAGLAQLGVSVDGPREVHDLLRGNPGSHAAALRALEAGREAGLGLSANTQINRLNCDFLEPLSRELRARGVVSWQLQLTVAMGRAADRPEWILEPWRVVDVIDTLARIQLDAAREYDGGVPFNVCAGNNVGYFGPHEQVLRSRPGGVESHWKGCQAGIYVIGIESDGTIKGCPSLPTAPYAGGNVRATSLEAIWAGSEQIRFSRDRDASELWGFCKSCYYADVCRAGCSWTAHCTLGKRGNNPFCYYRVKQLEKRGLRERLVQRERAHNEPYDFGRFEIVEEPWASEAPPPEPKRLPIL
jgi:radical SAM protein with 4Fe4S-binding SPASM domain